MSFGNYCFLSSQRDTDLIVLSPPGILSRPDTVGDHYYDPTLASAFAGALHPAICPSLPIGKGNQRESKCDEQELFCETGTIACLTPS